MTRPVNECKKSKKCHKQFFDALSASRVMRFFVLKRGYLYKFPRNPLPLPFKVWYNGRS